ncbi:SusC/RagA family TonB-linked outer membrane protein [Polluticaenibacter yanchengensis]|uniref:SusC/RagA family TonB-linked outer membrane protein n=1 Tax=Polluticaenibacter yanchengensis TaxID=3014562 RepID=A0ABT4UQT8_9BACT|nr:SusC/RagA family TonB-linked outer membrane protein [Chitinophagaceae bacterium LY-5]
MSVNLCGNEKKATKTFKSTRYRMTPNVFRTLKLSLLFTATFLTVGARETVEKVSLNIKNGSIESALTSITRQTGVRFHYNPDALSKYKPLDVSFNNLTLEEAIKICLKDKALSYKIDALQNIVNIRTGITPNSYNENEETPDAPQETQIKGTVKADDDGSTLAGATVTVKGTKRNTLTDNKGNFTISAAEGATLIISYVGYDNKEIKVNASGNYNIKLVLTASSVNDAVVTGMYVRPKANFTGASMSFSAEEISKVSNSNLLNALQSLDPSFQLTENLNLGSNPNVLANVVLRSGNSLVDLSQTSTVPFDYANGANVPLFILDGFEVPLQRINDLDINRVIRVDILKDAAATSIYGSRAANGVIVIETLRPKPGKLRFTYIGNVNVEAPDLTSYNLLNAREKFDLENKVNAYTFYNWNFREQDLAYFYNARLAAIESGINTDWISQPVQTGIGNKHSLYIEGGSEDVLYGLNLTYNNITGAMKGSDRRTITGNTYLSYRVKNFQFRNDLTINANVANNSPYGSFTQYTRLNPYWTPYDDEGNYKVYLEDVRNIYGNRLTNFDLYNNLDGQAVGRATNPLYNASLNIVDRNSYNNLINNFSTQWQASPWLRFTGRFAFQYQQDQSDKFLPAQHTSFVTKPTFEKGTYTKGHGNRSSYESTITADFNKTIGKNQFYATVGTTIQEVKFNTESVTVQGFPNPKLDQLVLGNGYAEGARPIGSESITRLFGLLSNVSYTYDNRYLLDFSFRSDGSSQFGTEKRFAPFWAAGAGWNLHNESFVKQLSFVDRLKIRYSYGYTGSQNFASYLGITTNQYYNNSDYRGVIGTYLLGFGNSSLEWQKTIKNNIGADITLFKKFDVTANYFIEKTNGSIASISTAPSTGFSSYSENMGDVIARGWEVYARYNIFNNNVKRNNLSVFVNIVSVKNKIERVSNTIAALNEKADNEKSTRPVTRYAAGQSTTSIWAVPSLGIDPSTGYEIFVKKSGELTNVYSPLDQVIVGDLRPKFEGTFGPNLELNGWGFNGYFRFRYGGQAYNQTLVERVENVAVAYYNVDRRVYEDRWMKPGDVVPFKGIIDNNGISISEQTYATSRFVQDDNLLSLENVSVYYRFPERLNKRLNLQNTKISLFASDIFRISSIKRERGLDYPFARTISLQIQTSF